MLLAVAVVLAATHLIPATRGQTQCDANGADYKYTETISADGNTRSIVTTWCPNHPYMTGLNPNVPIKKETTYTVPAKPVYTGERFADLTEQGGVVGVMFSSVQVYSPYGGSRYGKVTSQANSATVAEGNSFDQCGGHASSSTRASYHYHVAPPCLLQQLGQTATAHSPQIGTSYAAPYGLFFFFPTCITQNATDRTDSPLLIALLRAFLSFPFAFFLFPGRACCSKSCTGRLGCRRFSDVRPAGTGGQGHADVQSVRRNLRSGRVHKRRRGLPENRQ